MDINAKELTSVDSMLALAGDFGKYQVILLLLFSVVNVLSAFHYFGQTFISIVPEYECKLIDNTSKADIHASQCFLEYLENDTVFREHCSSGWNYNNSYGFISIIQELNWVCEYDWNPWIGQSMFFIGSVAGTLILGILADRIGRLHILVISNMFAFIGNLSTIFSTNLTIYSISRFVAGCATDSNFVMMYIIVMEYLRPGMRTFGVNICIGLFYCISCMGVPWMAVLMGDWKSFLLVVSVPHLLILTFYMIVPESAQWLISKERTEEAIKCFQSIATVNNKVITVEDEETMRQYCSKNIAVNVKHESLLGLLRTPKLRRKTLILVFKSMVMTLCYDTISRNINGIGYSPFTVFTITSATIFPACLVILLVQDRIGRKALASGSLFITGICTAISGIIQATIFIPSDTIILILAIFARFCINIAYNSGAQYAIELIPTVVRGQGVSAIHVAGYAASFFNPQILYLNGFWKPAPDIILSVLLVLGALACLFLPETLNKTLPISLLDGENFGEDEKIFQFSCCKAPTESTTVLTSTK